tara:strand:+ start:118 stop:405 length:288 start_codon:yes stop_codon:yes gene_type:complete
MEMIQIDTSAAPLEAEARMKWLWDQLDSLVQVNANIVSENEILEAQVAKRDFMLDASRLGQKKHVEEIIQMGTELNKARAAAATAVEDYRANISA